MSEFTYRWRQVQPKNDIAARSSHGVSVFGNKVVVFGGENVPRTPFESAIRVLDLSASGSPEWTELKPHNGTPPEPRVAHAQCVVDDCVYIMGGRQSITMEEAPLNDLYCFNCTLSTWENLTSKTKGNGPCPRSFHKMVAVGKKLYVFGGCAKAGRLADLYSFDIETMEWEELPSCEMISGRGGPGFMKSADNNSLFVIGGFSGKEMNDVFRYDIQKRSWDEVYKQDNNSVVPFSVSCGGILGRNIVFFGGEVEESNKGHEGAGLFSAECQSFDGVSGEITEIHVDGNGKPTPRGWAMADAWDGDKLIVFGGLCGDDSDPIRLNDLWVLEPIHKL